MGIETGRMVASVGAEVARIATGEKENDMHGVFFLPPQTACGTTLITKGDTADDQKAED